MFSCAGVCTRRRRIYRFLLSVATTVLVGSTLLASEEPLPTTNGDLFSGWVAGQEDPVTPDFEAVTVSAAKTQQASTPMDLSVKHASGHSLFALNRSTSARVTSAQITSSVRGSPSSQPAQRTRQEASQAIVSQAANDVDAAVIDIPPQMELVELNGVDVVIDGRVDEEAWRSVAGFQNMIVVDPDTLTEPEFQTIVRMFYTETGLYISADMEQPPDTLVSRLSARDLTLNRDGFTFTIDTSGKGLFGFWFGINLGGSKEDGKVLPERNFSREWDGAWHGATAVTSKGWSAEMFIPWSIVAMPPEKGKRRMNFFASRKVAFRNERYGWPALPMTNARFMSALQPIAMNEVNPKQQWELFPYAATSADGIYEETNGKVGVNFSWRPAPNMQVTGALNPDFGAVESDDVVVNLTAYETYFPEKRLFFLEGSEAFETTPRSIPMRGSSRGSGARRAPSTYTPEPTTVLNTRRIGGAARQLDVPDGVDIAGPELSRPTDLMGAVKMVGQTSAFRFGVLAAAEEDVELRGTMEDSGEEVLVGAPGRDFSVGRVLWERQSGTGRQAHGYINTLARTPEYDAMVHGFDSHFLTQNGKWSIDTQLLNSDKEAEQGYGGFADIRYTPRQGEFHRISVDYLDDTLDVADLGFLRRNDLRGIRYTRFNNQSNNLPDYMRTRSIGFFSAAQTNSNGDLIRGYLGTGITAYLKNQSSLNLQLSWRPSLVDDRSSFGNGSFKTANGEFAVLTYGTDTAKKFSYSVQTGYQTDELGDPAYIGDIGFTYSPVTRLRLDYDFRFRDSRGWVLSVGDGNFNRYFSEQITQLASVDFFLTARQQFRATMQWTGINATERDFWRVPDELGELILREVTEDEDSSDFTISRLTAQLRYRWEIAPLSDLFVVYTRGSNVPSLGHAEFGTLFSEALKDPIVDIFVVKLRYRFGS
ncbi:MAG: carbohydrate binding family 9 domain-containing protein [Gammaproteobacteria bacterium]|nr:carbohydrate binding family 9 domain-containing protein [Gammaproteobacteria bacterium]